MQLLDLLVFGVGLALAMLGVSYPILRLVRRIANPFPRKVALLTLGTLGFSIWLALLGYLFVPAHLLLDTAGRDGSASLWTMHAEERLIAHTYPADDARRIAAERTIAHERRWYAERAVGATLLLLVGVVGGAVHWLRPERAPKRAAHLPAERPTPPAQPDAAVE